MSQGYSHDLQRRYKKSNWLEAIGTGALIRKNEKVGYEGAIYALQTQADQTIHPGGRTALALLGKAHYVEFSRGNIILFGNTDEKLPGWFKKQAWDATVHYYETSFLNTNLGFTKIELSSFSIIISGAARALMECLYLAPQKQDLVECYELMEGLNNLPPKQTQSLLENCNSIKVKRLFLYLAEKAGHSWVNYIDMTRINLGTGKRSLVKKGVFIAKYNITVPKELEKHA